LANLPQAVRRVALCSTDFPNLGDVVALLPLIDGLARRFPGCHLLLAGRYPQIRLAERLGFTQESLLYQRADRGLLQRLRRFAPDLCVCLRRRSFRANLYFGRSSRASLTVGFAGGWNRWLHDRVAPYRPLIYRPRREMTPLEPLGAEGDLPATVRRVAALSERTAETEPVAVIMPGGSIPEKRWGVERYAAVARELTRERSGLRWRVVLGPTEVELGFDAVFARALPDAQRLTGLDLPDLARLFLDARVVLANDCGPAHLAQMGGIPIVQPFGNWDGGVERRIAWWFDRRPGAICLTTREPAPIDAIPVAAMTEAVRRLLAEPASPGEVIHTDRSAPS
jgi:ADP-heptose:LPS heptosyltransferase